MKRFLLSVVLALSFGAQAVTNTVLFVNEYGAVSSTNAMVTQAQISAVAASNQLVLAQMEAAEAGYQAALALLQQVAQSMATTPIVFYGVEVVGFDTAVVFGDDAALMVCKWERTGVVENKVVDGVTIQCEKHVLGIAFNKELQGVQPLIAYNTNVVEKAEWDNLHESLVSTPTLRPGSWYDGANNEYNNLYDMDVWVPTRSTGFCFVRLPNDAAAGDGSVMEFSGAAGGYNGEMQIGTNRIEFVNGVAYPAGGVE